MAAAKKGGIRWGFWFKMMAGCTVISVGGPALTYYLTPTEEELFQKYSPDLQKRSLEGRDKTQAEFNHFVGKLKEYSKSDKPIWVVAEEAAQQDRKNDFIRMQARKAAEEERLRKEAMRRELGLATTTTGADK